MSEHIERSKAELRREMKDILARISEDDRRAASLQACRRLTQLEAFEHAMSVMLYMPLRGEIDVTPVAVRCFQLGKTVSVPRVDWKRKDMTAVEVIEFDDHFMEVDEHGVRVPRDARPILRETIDLVVAPALAFDPQGHRLGRGGGYYDRYLSRLRRTSTVAGIAFDQQVVDEVPAVKHDMRVDVLVTDRRVTFPSVSRTQP